MRISKLLLSVFVLLVVWQAKAQETDEFQKILLSELDRQMSVLKSQEVPPYYMSYRVNEFEENKIESTFGNLESSDNSKKRILTATVRVGSHQLDNFHELRDDYSSWLDYERGIEMPVENDKDAISQVLWNATDKQYKKAMDKLAKVKANVAVKVEEEDLSADFSKEIAEVYYEAPVSDANRSFDRNTWEDKIRKYSEPFLEDPNIFKGEASIGFYIERKYFVSTEGVKTVENRIFARLFINASIKAEDGMVLPLYKSYFAFSPDKLPDDAIVIADAKEMVKILQKMKDAPVVEPYTGPALMSGEAGGVFFHEIFGHRVEGQRLKSEDDGQTFKKKVGEKVLPDHMSVIFDPTMKDYKGDDLNGFYVYDDQGVKGQKVTVVENGVLRDFLMSRCTIEGYEKSNGHGRADAGKQTVARQSNLVVETSKPLSFDKLRKKLIEEAKNQGKEYGYFFKDVTGGFTMTGRFIPNAFNVIPTEVYRVYVDGRPDELVRGVDLVGTPLAMFSQISEAGEECEIFTGTCGAESGGVPVTSVCPALLVTQIELQKKRKSQERPIILPRPDKEKQAN